MGDIIDFKEKKMKVEQKKLETEKRKKNNEKVIRKLKGKNKMLTPHATKLYLLLLFAVSVYVILLNKGR